MIGCIISIRKKNFFWNKLFFCQLWSFLCAREILRYNFFSLCCDITEYDEHLSIISWWPAANSWLPSKPFLLGRSDHVYYRYCWVDIGVDAVVDRVVNIPVDGWSIVDNQLIDQLTISRYILVKHCLPSWLKKKVLHWYVTDTLLTLHHYFTKYESTIDQ